MNAPIVPPVVPPPVPKKPRIFGVSKSTVQGYLSLAITILLSLAGIQLPATLSTPNDSHVLLWITFGASTLAGILKAILSQTQGDATES